MNNVVNNASINNVLNIITIIEIIFYNNCKSICRRNVNVNLIFNEEKFILFYLYK